MNSMQDKYQILKQYFGHETFRTGQAQIIDQLNDGQDVICIMPTGAGKSLAYQVPALMMPGITLVISPLISLMKDQVHALINSGIPAAYINSSLNTGQYHKVINRLKRGDYKLIYMAPERLLNQDFIEIAKSLNISFIAVDEAHCVSQWGQDFRSSYLQISDFIEKLSQRPTIGAFTATATQHVKEDIVKLLRLQQPFEVTTGFDRPNLHFAVQIPKDKSAALLAIVNQRTEQSGIVYCATRKNVEQVCDDLCRAGYLATRYHAGLSDDERQQNQENFVYDKQLIMVATNAFGMGIDKSNVSYVVHYNMPRDIESYYQEAGRAGRDGADADCFLLYAPADVQTNRFLIDNGEPHPTLDPTNQASIREKDRERLKIMHFYCKTNQCLRQYMLSYFGENNNTSCQNCSNCADGFYQQDVTLDAQKVLSNIYRMGQRFGINLVVAVLRGSKQQRILDWHFNKLSTYGIMKKQSSNYVNQLIDQLVLQDYLTISDDQYPILTLTSKAADVLKGNKTVMMTVKQQTTKPKYKTHVNPVVSTVDSDIDQALFDSLKALRFELAKKDNVPAYIIFSNATLKSICQILPTTKEQFLTVSGVGQTKLAKYGSRFIELINDYKND